MQLFTYIYMIYILMHVYEKIQPFKFKTNNMYFKTTKNYMLIC